LEIKLKEDKGLREKSVEVKEVNEEIINLCREMATLMNESGGAGLAAPQIGQNIRLFVVVNGLEQYYAFINPEIISQSDEFIVSQEGCLSYPGEEFCVLRRKKVMVKHLDTEGKFKVAEADDFLSCVLQHEIDHLNGILIEDRDDPMLRDQIKPVNTKPPKRKKRKKKK
jgi:peptide deformylase